MSEHKFRWGIISTGNIAKQMARALAPLENAELAAVGSRSQASADAFAQEFNVPKAYDSYAGVFDDPGVEVVYIATPHHLHKANALEALEAGKHVLLEKPFTVNAPDAAEVIRVAREKKLFLMEAFWYRFQPAWGRVREWLQAGAIGEPQFVQANLGFRGNQDPESRLLNPKLAGGALLDVGVYPVNMASFAFGGEQPSKVSSTWHKAVTGVDESNVMSFDYGDGRLASLGSSIGMGMSAHCVINGTKGSIFITPPNLKASTVTLQKKNKTEEITLPIEGNGYGYEATHVMAQLAEGKMESDLMPLDETLAVMKTLDVVRASWGLRYPFE